MIALWLAALLAQQPQPVPPASAPEPASKKDAYVAAKAEGRGEFRSPLRRGSRADQPIWAHNLRTNEIRALTGPAGLRDQAARSGFFRCWFTHQTGPIPAELVDRVISAATHFEVREVRIISGFRAPKYNLLLRKKGNEVAEQSEHTEALAIDFFLPGISTRTLYDWLLANHGGGVGFYPVSEFVHVDLGRKRTWKGT